SLTALGNVENFREAGAQIIVTLRQSDVRRGIFLDVGVERQALRFPQLAAAVEQAHLDAVNLKYPCAPCGKPVIVVAVEDDMRVGAYARLAQLLFKSFACGDVAAGRVDQFGVPVEVQRTRDMAA